MPTCNLHNQTYNIDEYCVYCGIPKTATKTNIDYLKELQKDLKKFEEDTQNKQNYYKHGYNQHCLFCGQYGGHGNLPCPKFVLT